MIRKSWLLLIIMAVFLIPAFAEDGATFYSNLTGFGYFEKQVVFNPSSAPGFTILGFSDNAELPSDGIGLSGFSVDSNIIQDGMLYGNDEVYAFWWIVDESGGILSVKKDNPCLHIGDDISTVEWRISNPTEGKWTEDKESGGLQMAITSENRSGVCNILIETGPVEPVASNITYTGTLTLTYKAN